MYEKIKADISNEYYLTNYPNDGQRFVAWYLRNIHNLDTYETKALQGMKLRKTQLSYRLKKMNGNVRKDGKIWNTGVALLKYFAGLNSNCNPAPYFP